MTAAPSGWLTEAGLNGLEAALSDYQWSDLRAGHIESLFTMARAALSHQAARETARHPAWIEDTWESGTFWCGRCKRHVELSQLLGHMAQKHGGYVLREAEALLKGNADE